MNQDRNWVHPVKLVGPVIVLVALMTWSLKVFLLTAGIELFSTSFHVARHHPGDRLGYIEIRILALILIGGIVVWIKLSGW